MLPDSLPILKELSLEMDMLNGWMPNIQYPISLQFETNEEILSNIPKEQLIYVGPRYVDSMEMFGKYLKNYKPTKHQQEMMEAILKKQQKLKLILTRPQAQQHFIIFDSDFESGNLDFVYSNKFKEYNLYMRCDTNSKRSHSWYYFSIICEQTTQIRIRICNLSKHKSLYERGMRPYICINGIWQQGGENIQFEQKGNLQQYYRLSFDLELVSGQKIFVAYGIPYTYTQMLNQLNNYGYSILTKTQAGLDIPILYFGQKNKRYIIATARVHPGESNSSHVLEGFLKYLTLPEGKQLIENSQVIVIPMLNPDGVVAGNFRVDLQGFDLNRQFQSPDSELTPQIYEIKKLIERMREINQAPPFMYLDFHGHSLKKNIFIYGPEYPVFSPHYMKCRILAKLMSQNTEIFRYWSGMWRIRSNKKTTARAILNQEYKIVHCFTIECSNGLYYLQTQQQTKEFILQDFNYLGKEIGKQIYQLIIMDIQYEQYLQERLKSRRKKKCKNPYLGLIKEIKQDEETHQIQEEDELIESESSQDEPKKKNKLIIKKFQISRQSMLRQEIECRKSFVSDRKNYQQFSQERSVEKSQEKSFNSQKPSYSFINFKRSVSSTRYSNCPKQLKQRMNNYGFI